nr:hypothetical protein Iba_chr08cCG7120 [Ipomoea batatas]
MPPLYSHDSSPNASSSFTKLELAPESGGSTASERFCKELIEEVCSAWLYKLDIRSFIEMTGLAFIDSFVMTEPLENADKNAFMSPVSSTSSVHENQPPPIHLTWETNEAICSNHRQMPLPHEFLVLLNHPSVNKKLY